MKFTLFSISYAFIVVLQVIILIVCDQDAVFKISKLNLVWQKAQHSLGPTKLKSLKSELEKHEQDELSLKKMKAHNQDKDGLFEATTRKRLLTILTKYSLERYYDDIHPSSQEHLKRENIQKSEPLLKMKPSFRDKKLDKLWKKAELSDFSQEQLMILLEEFQHQQDKLDEHYETMNQLDEKNIEEDEKENSLEYQKNQHRLDDKHSKKRTETASEKKMRLESNIHQGLKNKYSDIKKNYDKLHEKIATKRVVDLEGPFEEEAVNTLWNDAIEANFTSEELDSFKEELEHYESRIKKLKHFQNQLERDKISSKESSSNAEEHDESKHLKKKVKELSRTVEKTHKSLKQKISSERDEL